MKEIDFLPEWYKSGRRRQINVRRQYIALGGIFVVMIVWNFVATHSTAKTKAQLKQMSARAPSTENTSREFAKVRDLLEAAAEKADILEEIDSKIYVTRVLAEMSFLIDRKVVLNKVEFSTERLVDKQDEQANSGSVVRVAGGNFAGKAVRPLGDVRFKVVISGVAADASDVATLICKLEESPYFCQVVPSFSRSTEIKTRTKLAKASQSANKSVSEFGEKLQVSEFEINCYLANYGESVIAN
jgi:hypothetical protein